MKNVLRLLWPLLLLAILPGCSTFSSRAQEKSAVFNTLDAATRDRLKAGAIAIGDTPDMVYIAIGGPSDMAERENKDSHSALWIYNIYYDRFEGTEIVGYRTRVVTNPRTQTAVVFEEPVERPVYSTRKEERLRVTFTDGKVSAIERRRD
jgi:hypothetical protein